MYGCSDEHAREQAGRRAARGWCGRGGLEGGGGNLQAKSVGRPADQEAEAVPCDGRGCNVRRPRRRQRAVQILGVHAADIHPGRRRCTRREGGAC